MTDLPLVQGTRSMSPKVGVAESSIVQSLTTTMPGSPGCMVADAWNGCMVTSKVGLAETGSAQPVPGPSNSRTTRSSTLKARSVLSQSVSSPKVSFSETVSVQPVPYTEPGPSNRRVTRSSTLVNESSLVLPLSSHAGRPVTRSTSNQVLSNSMDLVLPNKFKGIGRYSVQPAAPRSTRKRKRKSESSQLSSLKERGKAPR